MEDKIEQLKHVEQQLECQKTELRVELERNSKRAQEDIESLKRQHAEEVEFLQQSNKQLKVLFLLLFYCHHLIIWRTSAVYRIMDGNFRL